jgi:hypothetical protein
MREVGLVVTPMRLFGFGEDAFVSQAWWGWGWCAREGWTCSQVWAIEEI